MQWNDVAGAVGKDAPTVSGLLGGPAAAAVGNLVAAALGAAEATPDAVSAALQADSKAAALKLKELETNSRAQLQQLALTAEQNRLQAAAAAAATAAAARRANEMASPSRNSVRKLTAPPPSPPRPKDWVRPTVTVILLLGAIGIVYFVFAGKAQGLLSDTTTSVTVGTVIGYWFNELKQTLAFWFGTTGEAQRSSAEVLNFAVTPGSVTMQGDETADKPGN